MSLVTFEPVNPTQVTIRPRIYKVDIGKVGFQGPTGPTGPQGLVSLADNNTWTGEQTYTGQFVVRESWLDPRDPLFGGIFDNASHPLSGVYGSLGAAQAVYPHAVALTDEIDWAATQAAINYMGSTAAHRAGRIYLPGWGVINRTLTQDHKAIEWEGKGAKAIAGNSAQSSGSGLRAGVDMVAGTPMLKVNSGWGSRFRNFRFLQSTSASNQPSAFIELNYAGAGDSPPNTMMDYDNLWFGKFQGLGSTENDATYPELTTLWGIHLTGGDFQLDQSEVNRCMFLGIGQAFRNEVAGLQQVLWWFRNCEFYNLQTNANISAQTRFTNCYSAFSRVRDFDVTGGRLLLESYGSELGTQLARMRGTCGLTFRDQSYFQITDELVQSGGIGLVIDAQDDNRQMIHLSESDFRLAGYTGGTWKIRLKGSDAGPNSHKTLILEDITENGSPIDPSHLDCAITSNLQQVTVMGRMMGPADISGTGPDQRFYQDMRTIGQLPVFNREDQKKIGRTINVQSTAGGVVTIDTDAYTEHRVSLTASGATFDVTGTPFDGQELVLRIVQDLTGGRTWTWPTTTPTMRYAGSTPPSTAGKTAAMEDGIRFEWDAAFTSWKEVQRWIGVV